MSHMCHGGSSDWRRRARLLARGRVLAAAMLLLTGCRGSSSSGLTAQAGRSGAGLSGAGSGGSAGEMPVPSFGTCLETLRLERASADSLLQSPPRRLRDGSCSWRVTRSLSLVGSSAPRAARILQAPGRFDLPRRVLSLRSPRPGHLHGCGELRGSAAARAHLLQSGGHRLSERYLGHPRRDELQQVQP
jgi:hypothetical protein